MEDVVEGEVVEATVPEADHVSQALEKVDDARLTLFRTNDPVEVVQAATQVADALKGVLVSQGLTSNISGRQYVRVEGWQTVGSMLGVFAVKELVEEIPWPDPVPEPLKQIHAQGKCFGFRAAYRAQRADGSVVGGAEADCRRSENTWKGRDDYAIKSMAQTRATSKALRAPLGFIVALAGYEATPHEEMPEPEAQPNRTPYGPAATEDQAESFVRAVEFLSGVMGVEVNWAEVSAEVAEKFGYLPVSAINTVGIFARIVKNHQEKE